MSYETFDTLFDDLLGFGSRPLSMHFSTPSTKDIQPVAKWKKDENTYYTVVRMVGIDPESVEVTLEDYGIHIKGESTTFGETYSQDVSLGIARETLQNIDEVTYDVKNGMCQISLIMKEPEVKKVAVTRLNVPQIDAPVIDDTATIKVGDIKADTAAAEVEDKPISRKRRFNK